jgi:hypothetical protein
MKRLIEKVYFRLRPEDKEKINAKAQRIGLTPSAFIRMATLSYRVEEDPSPPSIGVPNHPVAAKPGGDRHVKRIGE